MNQYRLTRRGKLVVILLLILITLLLVTGLRALVASFTGSQDFEDSKNPTLNESNSAIGFGTTNSLAIMTTSTNEGVNVSSESSQGDATNLAATDSQNETKQVQSTHIPQSTVTSELLEGIVTSEDERILLNASSLILFEQDKAELTDEMKKKIREFARTASAYSDFEITIRGVALKLIDLKKSEENAILRANAVSQYIRSLGILSNKIKIETKIVDHSDYDSAELSKAIAAELFFSGYQKEMK